MGRIGTFSCDGCGAICQHEYVCSPSQRWGTLDVKGEWLKDEQHFCPACVKLVRAYAKAIVPVGHRKQARRLAKIQAAAAALGYRVVALDAPKPEEG